MTNWKSLITAVCVVFAVILGGCVPQEGDANSQDGNSSTVAGEVIYKWDDGSLCTVEVGEPLTKEEWNKNPLSQKILLEGEYFTYKANVLEEKYMPKDKEKGDYATPVTWRIPGKHIEGIDANGTHPRLVLDNTPKGFILPYAKPRQIRDWVAKLKNQIRTQNTDELVQAKKDMEANNSNVKALQDKIASLEQDVKEKSDSLSKAQEEKKIQEKNIAELEEKAAMFKSGDKGILTVHLTKTYQALVIGVGLLFIVLFVWIFFSRWNRGDDLKSLRKELEDRTKELGVQLKTTEPLLKLKKVLRGQVERLEDLAGELRSEIQQHLDKIKALDKGIAGFEAENLSLHTKNGELAKETTQKGQTIEELQHQLEGAREKNDRATKGSMEALEALNMAQETVENTLKGLGVPDEHEKPIGPPRH